MYVCLDGTGENRTTGIPGCSIETRIREQWSLKVLTTSRRDQCVDDGCRPSFTDVDESTTAAAKKQIRNANNRYCPFSARPFSSSTYAPLVDGRKFPKRRMEMYLRVKQSLVRTWHMLLKYVDKSWVITIEKFRSRVDFVAYALLL